MKKRSFAALAFAALLAVNAANAAPSAAQGVAPPPAPPFLIASPAPINVTGKWQLADGGTRFSRGPVNLRQVGSTVVGDYASGQGSIAGTFATPRRLDATWNDDRGGGWITAYFSDDGHQISGEWGFKGRRLSGRFVGDFVQPGKP